MSENNYAALMMKRAPTNSESWDSIKDPGIYPIAAGHPSAPDGAAGVLFVMPPKSGATQDFISTSKKRYTRTLNNGAWLAWSAGMFVGDFGLGRGASHKDDAYNNIGEIYRVNGSSKNTPTTGVAGVLSLPCDGGPSAGYVAVSNAGNAWVGCSATLAAGVKWYRVYTTLYKPTPSDINAVNKSGDTMTGQLIAPAVATTPDAIPWGSGPYSEQLNNQAPFFQPNWQWPVTSGGVFVPIAKGTSTRKGRGWPTAVSYGYLMPGEDMHARPVIHALGDSGMENIWEFNTQTGGLRSGKAGEFATQPWVNDGLNGRVDWGTFNREVGARATTEYVNNNFVRDIRLASRGEIVTDGAMTEAPWGAVITGGNGNEGNQVGYMYFRYLQKNVNGNWYTVAYA